MFKQTYLIILCILMPNCLALTNAQIAPIKPWFIRVGLCGGALIDSHHVVTAAHCVQNQLPRLITLRRYLQDDDYLPKALEVTIHPDYQSWDNLVSPGVKLHDVAIIKLSAPVKSPQYAQISKKQLQTDLSLIGLGRLEDGSYPRRPQILNNLNYLAHADSIFWDSNINLLVSDDENQNFVTSFFQGHYQAIPVISGASACRGDSGSPLYKENIEGIFIAGLVSHGQDNCLEQDVFFTTDLRAYNDWIKQVIK